MRRVDISISLIVVLVLVLATTLVLGPLGFEQYRANSARLTRMLEREQLMAAEELTSSLVLPVWNFDRDQIEAIVAGAMRDNDIYAVLVNLVDARKSVYGRVRDSKWRAIATQGEPELPDLLMVSKPIVATHLAADLSAVESLGEVKVFVTTRLLNERMRAAAWSAVGSILAVDVVLTVLLYFLLAHFVFRPLRALERHANTTHTSIGADLAPLPGKFWGELERLRNSLQGMIRLLRTRFEALRQSEARYELAVAGTNEGIWDWDLLSNDIYYSPQFRRLLNYDSVAEFPPSPESFWSHIHRDDRARIEQALQKHFIERALFDVQYRLCTRSGEYRWFQGRGQAIWNDAGVAVRIAGSIADIHEQKRTEQSLQRAQERELHAREEFAQHLLLAQEQERQRLANELHDSVGQNLSLIKNRALLVLQETNLPPAATQHVVALSELATEVIAEVRAVAQNLRPLHIEQLGLTDALETLLNKVSEASRLTITKRLENVDDVIAGTAATHLFRIVQEAFNNILKHAGASRCHVLLERDLHSVRLTIADNGRGFDPAAAATAHGLGLASIAERVRMLTAIWNIDSNNGDGTTIKIEIPVEETALDASA